MKSITAAILLVDDSQSDQTLILRAFQKQNIPNPVISVFGANEAILYLNGQGQYADRRKFPYPTFILADLKTPDGNGFALLENLRSNPEWAVIPTIILSGSQDPDDIKKCYLLGANAYFVKPRNLDSLYQMVRTIYDFWHLSETPEVDINGQQLETQSRGRLGEYIPQPKYVSRPRSEEHKATLPRGDSRSADGPSSLPGEGGALAAGEGGRGKVAA